MRKLLLTGYVLLMVLSSSALAQEKIKAVFDERVDLISTVAMLSGSREYNNCIDSLYLDYARQYFDKMRSHEAVTMYSDIRKKNRVSYDAVADFALHIKSTESKTSPFVFDKSIKKGSDTSFDRWPASKNKKFLRALNDFYVKSDFHTWYESQKDIHDKYLANEQRYYDMIDMSWYEDFFEKVDNLRIKVTNSLLVGYSNYGLSYELKDGTLILNPVYGIAEWTDLTIIVHEFCHPYCNPLVDKYWDRMSNVSNRVFNDNKEVLSDQAYTSAKTMMYETLVRASVIIYVMELLPQFYDDALIEMERDNGFGLIEQVVNALRIYRQSGSEKYPTLDSFMPTLISLLNITG